MSASSLEDYGDIRGEVSIRALAQRWALEGGAALRILNSSSWPKQPKLVLTRCTYSSAHAHQRKVAVSKNISLCLTTSFQRMEWNHLCCLGLSPEALPTQSTGNMAGLASAAVVYIFLSLPAGAFQQHTVRGEGCI